MDFCCLIYVLTDTGLNGPLRLAGSPIFVDTVKKNNRIWTGALLRCILKRLTITISHSTMSFVFE